MKWIAQFDLFLFDFDGLLVDTESLHFAAYKQLCLQYGHTLSWDMQKYLEIAHGSSEGLRKAIHPHLENQEKNWENLYEEKKKIYTQLLSTNKLTLMLGVEKFLKKLSNAKAKRGVVTNASKKEVDIIIQTLPILKTIPTWITREEYVLPKPAPDAYLKAMEFLADDKDRIIGFEDSLKGIQALQETRAFPVLICETTHLQLHDHRFTDIHHFSSFQAIPNSFNPWV